MQETSVQSLVRELRAHMPLGQKKKKNRAIGMKRPCGHCYPERKEEDLGYTDSPWHDP